MSMTDLVWKMDLKQNIKFILLALANEYDNNRKRPSIEKLSKMTGYSVDLINRLHDDLSRLGFEVNDLVSQSTNSRDVI